MASTAQQGQCAPAATMYVHFCITRANFGTRAFEEESRDTT